METIELVFRVPLCHCEALIDFWLWGSTVWETDLTLYFTKVAKTHGYVFGTLVMEWNPLGMVSEAPGVWGIDDPTVGRQKSAHSKIRVTLL